MHALRRVTSLSHRRTDALNSLQGISTEAPKAAMSGILMTGGHSSTIAAIVTNGSTALLTLNQTCDARFFMNRS
jgi:hypothetical protein